MDDEQALLEQMTAKYAHVAPELWQADRGVFRVKETSTHWVEVMPFIFTAGVVLTPKSNDGLYDDRWCYNSILDALAAALMWDPSHQAEPDGWHRHPSSGRRRVAGDPASEYVNH